MAPRGTGYAVGIVIVAWVWCVGAAWGSESGNDVRALRNELGVAFAVQGDLGKAESAFVSILSSSPSDPRALLNLGNVCLLRGEAGPAREFYRRALSDPPSDPAIHYSLGVLSLLEEDPDAAANEIGQVLNATGDVDSACNLVGLRTQGLEVDVERQGTGLLLSTAEVRDLLEKVYGALVRQARAADSTASRSAEKGDPAGTPVGSQSASPSKAAKTSRIDELVEDRGMRVSRERGEKRRQVAELLYWKL